MEIQSIRSFVHQTLAVITRGIFNSLRKLNNCTSLIVIEGVGCLGQLMLLGVHTVT